jgi:hypothetical protein
MRENREMNINHRIVLRWVAACAVALLLVTAVVPAADAPAGGKLRIDPDPAIQSAIIEAGHATDKAAFDIQVHRLNEMSRVDLPRFVAQIMLYSAIHSKDAATKPLVGRILKQLDLQRESVVAALVPHLDNAAPAIVKNTRELLAGYEDRSVTRGPDFSAYRAIIEADVQAGREPQTSLVGFMFESDPGAALRTMVRSMQLRKPDEIKPILWGEHLVAELLWKRQYGFVKPTDVDAAAVEQVEKLSRHNYWWVRLYVAAIIKTHPELGTRELMNRLAADANACVRSAIVD